MDTTNYQINELAPFISIIIPVYNVEKYIKRALESCINQSFNDIEIIIINDCGSDNSINIAEQYASKDSRIKIFYNQQNLGAFNARLEGIKKANGEYLLFLDSDDYLDINVCKKVYKKILDLKKRITNEENLPDIIFFGMDFYPKTLKRIPPPILMKTLHDDEILKAVFTYYATPPWHIWAKLYKTSHIARTINLLLIHMDDFPRLNMAEDVLKNFAIMALARKSIGIKDKLYMYCNNDNSITRKIDIDSIKKKINDLNVVINYLDKLSNIKEISSNKNFKICKIKTQKILKAQKELETRYLNPNDYQKIAIRGGAAG